METILIPGCEEGEVPVTMFECNDRTIQSIGHNASSNRLCVRFKNGLLHVYPGVAPGFFERFCTAPSKTSFWKTYVRGLPGERVFAKYLTPGQATHPRDRTARSA
ncbi:MAG: KTSC domain-containing protein [Terriglobales bacterium]|jgi:hypothetical protein